MTTPKEPKESALHVMEGVKGGHDGVLHHAPKKFRKKAHVPLDVKSVAKQIREGDRTALSRAITLIESSNHEHMKDAQRLLKELLPYTGNSIRIGITGVPGAGKSSFIETFGTKLCQMGKKVAVLAIDPSSTLSGGSILGDKTRMENLVREPNSFVRPSPSAGTLGGVHKKSRETMLLCEAAGYEVILIETVGVGQSETYVRGMVDFFMLLVLTGAGDELQGMKKGIMELADAIIVHKADGENLPRAKKTMHEYKQMLHFLRASTPGWTSESLMVSSLEKTGLGEVWDMLMRFKKNTTMSGVFHNRRQSQTKDWFYQMLHDELIEAFYRHKDNKLLVEALEKEILAGQMTVSQALEKVFENRSY